MKKFLLPALFLLLVLTACATADTPASETQAETQATETNASTESPETETESSAPAETAPETRAEIPTSEETTEADTEPSVLCANENYTISLAGENCYINFSAGNDVSPDEGFSQIGSIDFPSLSEMKNSFLNNNLTSDQMLVIRSAFADETNGIRLCNLNALFTASLPSNVTADTVTLKGDTYYFNLSSETVTGSLTVATESAYQFNYNRDFKDIESYEITKQESGVWNGSPCEIVEYTVPGNGDQYRDVYLTINESIQIEISYCLKNSAATQSRPVSETLPWRVLIFGCDNGQHFYSYLRDFTTAPTVEWLSSFGITPYVESGDHVVS